MKTLIQALFPKNRKALGRKRQSFSNTSSSQLIKMGKLGGQLVVMSR